MSPALAGRFFTAESPGKPNVSLLFKLLIGFLLPVAESILINILINSAHLVCVICNYPLFPPSIISKATRTD